MPETKNDRDQDLEERYQQSPGQDEVDRGTREAEDYANQGDESGDAEPGEGRTDRSGLYTDTGKLAESVLDKTSVGRAIKPALKVIGRNKGKSGAVGGVFALILTLVLAGFFGLKQFELIHMMKIFQNYAFVASEYTEGSRTSRLLGKTLQNGRKMDPDRANMEGNRRRTGRLVSDWVNDSRLNKLESNLQKKGFSIDYHDASNGKVATKIIRPDGEEIELKEFKQSRREIRSLIKEEIPAYRVGKRFRYYRLMNYRTGWNRKFFVGRKARSSTARLRSRVRGEEDFPRVKRVDEQNLSEEERQRVQEAREEVKEQKSHLNNAMEQARTSGRIKLRLGDVLSATGVLMAGCIANQMSEETENRRRGRYEGPMVLSQEMLTASDQLKDGGETVANEEYGELMNEVYHNVGTPENPGQHWDETLEYKLAADIRPAGEEPSLPDDYYTNEGISVPSALKTLPLISALTGFVQVSNFLLPDSFCQTLTKTSVQIGLDVVDLIVSGFTSLAGTAIEWALELSGASETAMEKLLVATAGERGCMQYETSPHLASSCTAAGTVLNNTEHVRSNMGAPPLPEDDYNEIRNEAEDAQHNFLAQKGFFHRYLSLDNPYSVTSRVAVALPKTLDGVVRKTADIPSALADSLGSILIRPVGAQWEQGRGYKTYGLEHFGFTEEEIQRIDPVKNENKVLDYLNYYCWKEPNPNPPPDFILKHAHNGNVGNGCNKGKFRVSVNMREYLYCSQLPYNEPEDDGNHWRGSHCQEHYRREGDQWLSGNNLVSVGMWMFDRYTVENLSQLTSDIQLNDEITFDLLDNIEQCAQSINEEPPDKIGESEGPPPRECYEIVDREGSMFYSKGYIEGEGTSSTINRGNNTSSGGGGSGTDNLPDGETKELAQQILSHPNITFDPGIRTSFVQAAKTGAASTGDGGRTEVSSTLLAVILRAANKPDMPTTRISSLTTGRHSSGSTHYSGQGVDIGNEGIAAQLMPYIYRNRGNFSIHELIYAYPPSGIQNLKNGSPTNYSSSVLYGSDGKGDGDGDGDKEGHENHIHISTKK